MSQPESSIARRQAWCELLTTPDPADLHRGSVVRLDHSDRYRLLEHLAVAAFIRARFVEIQARHLSRETNH
jgi:hypothetical protein